MTDLHWLGVVLFTLSAAGITVMTVRSGPALIAAVLMISALGGYVSEHM